MGLLRRLSQTLNSRPLPWFLTGVLATLLATNGLAIAGTDPSTFTGCLKKGLFLKVAVGDAPLRPCASGETQVTWTSDSPGNVLISEASLATTTVSALAEVSPPGIDISGDTVTWSVDPDADYIGRCLDYGYDVYNPACFEATLSYDPSVIAPGAVAQAILVEGVADIPSAVPAAELERHPATSCDWRIDADVDSSLTDGTLMSVGQVATGPAGTTAGMGAIDSVPIRLLVFIGANPSHELTFSMTCEWNGQIAGYDDCVNQECPPLAYFEDPLVISNLSIKVITFGAPG